MKRHSDAMLACTCLEVCSIAYALLTNPHAEGASSHIVLVAQSAAAVTQVHISHNWHTLLCMIDTHRG